MIFRDKRHNDMLLHITNWISRTQHNKSESAFEEIMVENVPPQRTVSMQKIREAPPAES